MHEESLVRALLKQVDQLRREHHAQQVTEVRVEAGPLSGVEPMQLVSAFERLAPASTVAGARLVVDEVPLLASCKSCDREFQVSDFVFYCPNCGGNARVIRGDQVQLVSVSLRSEEPTEEFAS